MSSLPIEPLPQRPSLPPLLAARFATLRPELRPALVTGMVERARPRQTAAWRRLGGMLFEMSTHAALAARLQAQSAEPDVCSEAAAEMTWDGAAQDGEEGGEDGDGDANATPE